MKKLLMVLFLQMPLLLSAQRDLQFTGEKIDFYLDKSHFTINGLYLFTNNSNHEIRQTLFFPITGMVDSFVVKRVYNMTYNQNISFQSKKTG
jgi:hypothetical protein